MLEIRTVFALSFVSLASLTASCSDPTEPATGSQRSAILNGSAETGWDSVGALTEILPGQGYVGSHCTGIAVHAEWVLTSASCLDPTERSPKTTFFYVGTDANPTSYTGPASGALYALDAFYPHPSFDDQTGENNIALAHLAQPISGISFTPISSVSMSGADAGEDLLYVGFGESNGTTLTGGGLKRSVTVPIEAVWPTSFESVFDNGGLCLGYLGGPALRQVSGTWRVVGVTSSMTGSDCEGPYTHMRADAYLPWATSTMNNGGPPCTGNPGLCHCDIGCQSSGVCDNALCHTSSCDEVYDCLINCGSPTDECALDCYLQGTDTARADFDAFYVCAVDQCDQATDFAACLDANCPTELETCFPAAAGSMTCEQVYTCVTECAQGDVDCTMDCYEQGTVDAQQQFDDMLACFDDHCAGLSDDDFLACIDTSCATEIETCMPSEACELTGGDCPSGEACYPTTDGTACFTSDGLGLGMACDPSQTDHLPCGDGLICVGAGTDGTCEQLCREDTDCTGTNVCEKPVFTSLPELGTCVEGTDVDGGVEAGADSAAGGAGAGGAGGAGGTAGSSGASGAGGTSGSSGAGGSSGSGTTPKDATNDEDDGGCGCRTSGAGGFGASSWAWLAAALLLLRRR